MKNPTIVIVAFDRPLALQRLLYSISNACFANYNSIQLIISIDGGGINKNVVLEIAKDFQWSFGKKEIINYDENLGLRRHVIACGDLVDRFENIIMLEEDLYVSKNFYNYSTLALDYYANDRNIAGISLYNYKFNDNIETIFTALYNGSTTYFMQVPSSWGQVWSKKQWSAFKTFYNNNPIIKNDDKIPTKVKTWPESSWKKYFYKYMVESNTFFVYPIISFSTNFGDKGTHHITNSNSFQVYLENFKTNMQYDFDQFSNSINIYDAYSEILPECLIKQGVNIDFDTCVDLYGTKPFSLFNNKYALSSKTCKQPLVSYDNILLPITQNILNKVNGNSIHYSKLNYFGNMKEETKIGQIVNEQNTGYNIGVMKIKSEKTFKIGYYILNPFKILNLISRKFKTL